MSEQQNKPLVSTRVDPFGQRYLRDEAAVFEHNAWDNVDWTEEKEHEINETLKYQKECPVPEETVFEILDAPEKNWEEFYRIHKKFFMDRKWLMREFSELSQENFSDSTNVPIRVLDVGCGCGNTTIPLLEANSHLFIYSCDFSKNAIEVLSHDSRISSDRCHPFIWDITDPEGTDQIPNDSLDFILCIFVLSALPPSRLKVALRNMVRLLKPGGMLMFKDYARHDLTQLRFKSGRLIDDNLYRRGDSTLVYFFASEEIDKLLKEVGLEKVQNFVDKRLVVNRAKKIKMYRRWIQCKYIKPIIKSE